MATVGVKGLNTALTRPRQIRDTTLVVNWLPISNRYCCDNRRLSHCRR